MPSKSEAILSSHRDAATRITKHFSARHNLALKPNDALDVVALALGAANWKTLRAMAEQGRAPRMSDVGNIETADARSSVSTPKTLAQALFKAADLATLRATVEMGYLPPERVLAAYDFIVTLESQNRGLAAPDGAGWESHVTAAATAHGIYLSLEQNTAALSMAGCKFSVLAGHPGTGKATCVRVFTTAIESGGGRVLDLCTKSAMDALQHELDQLDTAAGLTLPYEAVVLDERALEGASATYALLRALPATCRVVLVVDTSTHRLCSYVVNALKSVGNGSLVEFHTRFRQVAPDRVTPLAKVVKELHARLHQQVVGTPSRVLLAEKPGQAAGPVTEGTSYAFDVFSRSALTFVSADPGKEGKAAATVSLYASLMPKTGLRVLDLRNESMHTASDAAGLDVLVLDESGFESRDSLERLAQLLPSLKASCRVVVLFQEWWPEAKGAKEMLEALQEPARKHIPARLCREGGEVRVR